MAVKSDKELTDQNQATWLKALSAMELKNYGYVIQLMQPLLRAEPSFLVGRQLLRKAEIRKAASAKKGLFGMSGGSLGGMKLQSMVKKEPLASLDAIEKALENDPFNSQINHLLSEAALAVEMPELAAFALETIIEGNPKDTKTMHELGQLYVKHDEPEKAVDIYTRITDMNPTDLAALKAAKDAAARASMKRGGWENKEATYRDLIRDKEAAISMEQQGRVVRSDEMIEQQLAELGQKYEENPENVDVVRKIAQLYEQKLDLESAVQWYEYAAGLTKNTDLALVRKAADLRIKQLDTSILQYEQYIDANPEADDIDRYRQELDELRKSRGEFALAEARQRVERNPTDLTFRFELAEVLVNQGMYKEAVPELQKARQNPNVRLRAMSLLGRCFIERNMLDLAAKTFEDTASEIVVMDATKKDVIYNLGIVYEKMGNTEKAIDCFKQIYEVDYGYRDVAEKVESSYS